jgi:hypothetical protein
MLFTLEALEAAHGDALLLHYGTIEKPRLIIVDGGPAGTYAKSLGPRLEQLRSGRSPGGSLKVRLAMVSHIDDDHIQGLLDLTDDLIEQAEQGGGETVPAYDILTLWHNSFDDLTHGLTLPDLVPLAGRLRAAALADSPSPALPLSPPSALVAASVGQGRRLRDNALRLRLNLNQSAGALIAVPGSGPRQTAMGSGLDFTVLGPRQTQLEKLRNDWAMHQAAAPGRHDKRLGAAAIEAVAAAFVDQSVYNLSSIVVLVDFGGKRMLLTGDARGDLILESLTEGGLMQHGTIHVDLLKVPHHGSVRDVDASFFEQISADHYVISADGKYGNPKVETLELLFAARGDAPYSLYMTNRVAWVDDFIGKHKPKNVRVVYREPRALSVRVNLGSPLAS